MTFWLTFWTLGVSALLAAVFKAWKATISGNAVAGAGALFLTLFSLPFLAGEGFGVFTLYKSSGLGIFAVIAATIGTNVLFHYLLKAPTRAGRALLDRIEGFKMFLSAVDGDRINRSPANQTPAVFERFLPFALALGVEHAWAEKFSQVLAYAGASGNGSASYSPSWYTGNISAFSPADFTSSFSDSFSSAISSSSSPPSSSSGFSGAGSSGGGGGGGGGGGW
jgi:uncharacterized membrane protein